MSDNWAHFFATMGENQASILFDDGLAETIGSLPHQISLKIELTLQEDPGTGLTTDAEAKRLEDLSIAIEKVLVPEGAVPLGRVTVNGVRWLMYLLRSDAGVSKAESIIEQAGYACSVYMDDDPEKSVYWDDLYPTEDDRQVMRDMRLLDVLRENGDRGDIKRAVAHWSYFQKKSHAKAFALSLLSLGYDKPRTQKSETPDDGKWLVRSKHEGKMTLRDVSHHSLAHHRLAKQHSGRYDGWETRIENRQGGS